MYWPGYGSFIWVDKAEYVKTSTFAAETPLSLETIEMWQGGGSDPCELI